MDFWLGTHMPNWLALTDAPLMVSRVRLRGRKSFPRACGPWFLDSGGFSQLDQPPHGWDIDARQYVAEVRCYASEIGQMAHCSPQDWMCEPWILKKTGKSLAEHQRLTVENFVELREIAPELPWVPVLQGWRLDDYLRCVELYQQAGVDLLSYPLVGVGSVCRRQATVEAALILGALAGLGLRLHGFGFKLQGFDRCGALLASADSMSWSMDARKNAPLPGHTHKNCANCLDWALLWREKVVRRLSEERSRASQLHIADGAQLGQLGQEAAVLPCAACSWQPATLDRWALDEEERDRVVQMEVGGLCALCGWPLELSRQQVQSQWRERVTARQAGDQLALPLVA